jgi:threonine dehydrogenase-like Zn-dependent dehydrogenase
VQIAKALGAKVIATASSDRKLEVAKRHGADFGVDYSKEGWQKEVLKITEGHGADVCVLIQILPLLLFPGLFSFSSFSSFSSTDSVVLNSIYDPVGMIVPSLKCIAWNGRVVVVGFAAGKIEQVCFRFLLFPPLICAHSLLNAADPRQSRSAQEHRGPRSSLGMILFVLRRPFLSLFVLFLRLIPPPTMS